MNPSPEIVTLPRRPHIAAWGDTVAWPGLFLLVGGSLVALAMWLFFRREPEAQAAIWVGGSGVILLAAFVITLVNAIRRRRQSLKDLCALETRVNDYAAALDNPQARPAALRRLAQLASLRASRRGRWFDLALWARVTGDRSPRIIITAQGLDEARRPVEGVTEEFDLFSQPPASLRLLVGEVAVWFITLAVIAFMLLGQTAVSPRVATIIIGAAALIGALYFCRRAAIRMIAIRSVIASPGRIEFGGLLGAVTFTIDDAMLFVVDRNEDVAGDDRLIEIILQRQDNAMRRLRLNGPGDPRTAEAIARWVAGCPAPVAASA